MNSIGTKSLLGYFAILITSCIAAFMLINASQQVEERTVHFVEVTLPSVDAIEQIAHSADQLSISAYQLYGTTLNPQGFNGELKKHKTKLSELLADNGILSDLKDTPQLLTSINRYYPSLNGLYDVMSANSVDWDSARVSLEKITQQSNDLQKLLDQMKSQISQQASQSAIAIENDIKSIHQFIFAMVLIIGAVTAAAYFVTRRSITQPVKYLAGEIKHVADHHDLTVMVKKHSDDEVGVTASNINQLLETFKNSLSDVKQASSGIGSSVIHLTDQARSADNQVSRLNSEITTLVEHSSTLERSIEQSFEQSCSAAKAAKQGASQVEQGAREVEATSSSIATLACNIEESGKKLSELKDSGDQVSGVVGTIAEIAEQTNLLALNAAIEAARAGETGRGFAVVADEVRTLANRTQQSTIEINEMLTNIVNSITEIVSLMESNTEQADKSVELAKGTVSSLSDIKQSILNLSSSSQEVAGLTDNARTKVQDVQQQVSQFKSLGDAVTESSVQTKDTSHTLEDLAQQLDTMIHKFKID